MKKLILLSGMALLAACGGEEQSELRRKAAMTKDLRGRVDPLPQVRTTRRCLQGARACSIRSCRGGSWCHRQPSAGGGGGGVQPDLNRPKEPLEAFPLEAMQMVGTLAQNKDTYALVRAGNNLFRVKKGNYMGQNFGVITAIDESQINLKEVVQDSGGDWVERTTTVQMLEGRK